MVEQAARGRDQDVDAAHQFGILIAERNAADQQCDGKLLAGAITVKVLLDLCGKFACRLEDQSARHACARASFFQQREHRKNEGRGLAGAGLGDAENVLVRQNVRDGLFLNGGGGGVSGGRNGSEDLVGQAEIGKGH